MSTNEITTFNFNTSRIRVVARDRNPWFVAEDACSILGHANTSNACLALDQTEKFTATRSTYRDLFSFGRGSARLILISESGLYKLVMRSDKPQAKPFQDWVTKVVLPAIRKDGGYILGEENVKTPEDEDALILRAMEVMKRKIARLSEENAVMSKELNVLTVDEYRALRHAYWPHGFKVRMGQRASAICANRGLPVETQQRTFTDTAGKTRETSLKVYLRSVLDEAYAVLSHLLPAPVPA